MATRQANGSRVLRVVFRLDALGSAALPALLLAAVPLLTIVNLSDDLVGALILAFAVLLGAMGAIIAWTLGKAMTRGDTATSDIGWLLRDLLTAQRGVWEPTDPPDGRSSAPRSTPRSVSSSKPAAPLAKPGIDLNFS